MRKTRRERQNEKRNGRLEKIREQIASGELTVRQMTREERERWDEHSAASARDMTPDERARRKRAREKRADIEARRRTASPPDVS